MARPAGTPRVVLVMGAAGSGKSTIGNELSRDLGARFIDADAYHPRRNVDRMRRGIPLEDADRVPWLRALHRALARATRRGEDVVVACSALSRLHRKLLLSGDPPLRGDVTIVFLRAGRELLRHRLETRTGHFAGPALLESQLATLEPPRGAIEVDAGEPVEAIVEQLLSQLGPGSSR